MKPLAAKAFIPHILDLLHSEEMFGYEINKKLRLEIESDIKWKEGNLYPVLKYLEKQRLISSYWNKDFERPRKYYRIKKKTKLFSIKEFLGSKAN